MSDIEKFISERKVRSPKAWAKFEEKYHKYAIGMLLAEHRENGEQNDDRRQRLQHVDILSRQGIQPAAG